MKGSTKYAPWTFTTKSDAKNWLRDQETAVRHPEIFNQLTLASPSSSSLRPVFKEYALRHIDVQTTKSGKPLSKNTKSLYLRLLNQKLTTFHGLRLDEITTAMVADWWAQEISREKITSSSKAYKLLNAVLRRAVDESLIATNPAKVRGAQNASTNVFLVTPSIEEMNLLAVTITPRYKELILVLAYSGLRFGEVTALTAADVTLVSSTRGSYFELRVNKAVSFEAGVFTIGTTKSESGVRNQKLPIGLTHMFQEYLSRTHPEGDDLVFPSASGSYLRNDVLNTAFKRALLKAGLSGRGFSVHALRRGAATELANQGANIAEVQNFLGDSSATVALRYINETNRQLDLINDMKLGESLL